MRTSGLPLLVAFAMLAAAFPSAQQPAARLNWAADDEKRVAELAANGRRLEGTHVVVWTPATVAESDHRALVERLDRGVAALRERVGSHDWQSIGARKVTYYISADRFVSHGSGRAAVFIPLARMQDGRAPYLHEAMHELLALAPPPGASSEQPFAGRQRWPLWLFEGLPDYVAQSVASGIGIAEGDVFDIGGLAGVDRTCAARLKGQAGPQVLPFIGAPGRPDALFTTERQTVAPTFYACAFSFTKFIVDRVGLARTIALIPLMPADGVHRQIETLAGKPVADLRAEWLRAIGLAPGASDPLKN